MFLLGIQREFFLDIEIFHPFEGQKIAFYRFLVQFGSKWSQNDLKISESNKILKNKFSSYSKMPFSCQTWRNMDIFAFLRFLLAVFGLEFATFL